MSKFNPKIITNFLENDTCDLFLKYANSTNDWIKTGDSDFWDKRTIYHQKLIELGFDCRKIITDMKTVIEKEYELKEEIYADSLILCRWFEKSSQTPHCDNMIDFEEQHKKHGHRHFGAIIYLNDNYDGGRTYYPEHNFEIIPKSGALAVHLADCDHRHGVTEVTSGIRYTLASFWTFNKSKSFINFD